MLNPKWKNLYNSNDFSQWRKIDALSNSIFDEGIIDDLLDKYYRNQYDSGLLRGIFSHNQKRRILDKTMEELALAIEKEKRDSNISWRENQLRDESLETKLERESSIKISKYDFTHNLLGHRWIEPNGNFIEVPSNITHFNFLLEHMELWNENIKRYYEEKLESNFAAKKDHYFEHILMMSLFNNGWISTLNNSARMCKKGLPTFIKYLKDNVSEEERFERICITVFDTSDFYDDKISNFVDGLAFREVIKTAKRKTVEYDATDDFVNYYKLMRKKKKKKKYKKAESLPNPWKKNYDYGEIPNFIDRLKWFNEKRKKRKEAILDIINNFIKK